MSGNRLSKRDKALKKTDKNLCPQAASIRVGIEKRGRVAEMTDYNKRKSEACKTLDRDACYEKKCKSSGE